MIHISRKALRNSPSELNLLSQRVVCFLCFSSFVITKDVPIKTKSFSLKATIFLNINLHPTSKLLFNDIIVEFLFSVMP